MVTLSSIATDSLDSSAPSISGEAEYKRAKNVTPYHVVVKSGDDNFLADCLKLNQVTIPESGPQIRLSFPLPFRAGGQITTLDEVCNALRLWDEYAMADRIAYFASDEDLEEGDVPLTLASACGFLSFFEMVKSDGRISLTCSPEGWLCVVWRFSDERRASLWFLDTYLVMFSATDAAGNFIEIDGGSEVGSARQVMAKLVETGLFTWNLDRMSSRNFPITTMLPDIVANEILAKMGHQWMERFYSALMNPTFPQTGWSIFIHQTDNSSLMASSSHYEARGALWPTTLS